MSFVWKKLTENDLPPAHHKEDNIQELTTGCSVYFAVDSPTCTSRGKYRKERKVCWDTIKDLKLNGKKLVVNEISYKILFCSECEDYFLEEDNNDLQDEEVFICFECNKIK